MRSPGSDLEHAQCHFDGMSLSHGEAVQEGAAEEWSPGVQEELMTGRCFSHSSASDIFPAAGSSWRFQY
ncbi:hypothetical protein scyTo_0011309 [Scyliorhinus torazame]|uniref:Uncharacterized protein n=1 Tax=Scyliorhinus torazame TaxID=75743 RepID=A0A401NKM2_SCYTO|nr:hypothetical protein [Scyliorhinus torazame]